MSQPSAFGKGKLSALFFKKGSQQTFLKKKITWKDIMPDFLVAIVPIIAGTTILFLNFSWFILVTIICLIALVSSGNAFVRGSLACKFCKQKEISSYIIELYAIQKIFFF